MWNRQRGGDTPELRDRKIRRLEESIVEQEERRRYSRAKRQEDQKTGGEYSGTGREEEILQNQETGSSRVRRIVLGEQTGRMSYYWTGRQIDRETRGNIQV